MDTAKEWKAGVPDYWKKDVSEVLDRWAIHEEWVLRAKSIIGARLQSFRLEDLCKEPIVHIKNLFRFLEVDGPEDFYNQLSRTVKPNPNIRYASFHLSISQRAKRIMKIYDYL